MDMSKSRRTFSLVASAALITSLAIGAYAAPTAAKPSEQQLAAKQERAEARAAAKALRDAAKEARALERAKAKALRQADRDAAKQARAVAKAARKAEKQALRAKVDVCHKPGTPAEGTISFAAAALQAHLDHGDTEEACVSTAAATVTTCSESDGSDAETALVAGTEEDDATCDDSQQVLVSIEAPESIDSQDLLQLEGSVTGLDPEDLTYAWASTCLTDEELTDPAVIASEPDTAVLVIREDTLPAGTTCEYTLTVTDEADGEVGSAPVAVEVLVLP